MKKASALVYHEHGDPEKVLRHEAVEIRPPGAGEALIEMLAAPINPANLNAIEGTYARLPALPAVGGGEGMGVVRALGAGVDAVKIGTRVLLPFGEGTWCQFTVRAAAELVAVPEGISDEHAGMLRVNPPTAWRMLHDFVTLQPGEWVIQNAANSGVGRAVIQIAKAQGWRTVNVVRRPELIEELQAEGADVVLLEGRELRQQVPAATGGAPIRLALNAVGGDSASYLASVLAEGGTVVTYGAMAKQPLKIANGLLIFRDLAWRGFWVTRWYENASRAEVLAMFNDLFPLAQRGLLLAPIERRYALTDFAEAIARAKAGERAGKLLFTQFQAPR